MNPFFDQINASVSIAGRMRILGVLLVLPVAFTGYLLFNSHMLVVNFANNEIAGSRYLTAVWPAMVNGARNQAMPPAAITAIGEVVKMHPELAESGATNALGAMTGDDLLAHANTIVAEVTDKSQLILDPDLDSYYMMDVVAVKIPAVMVAARALNNSIAAGGFQHQIDQVTFDNAVAAMSDSLKKSGQYGSGKHVSADTGSAWATVLTAAKALRSAESPSRSDGFITALDALFAPANRDLQNLLEARAAKETGKLVTELFLAISVLLTALVFAYVIASGLSGRLKILSSAMARIVSGNAIGDIPYQNDRHETGIIARSLHTFQASLAEAEALRQAQQRLEQSAVEQRRQSMFDMADRFQRSVLTIVDRLGQSTDALGQTARTLSNQAEQTRDRTHQVAIAMDDASMNVQSVASATEEMAASSSAISDQAERATEAVNAAAVKAQETTDKVTAMKDAADSIGSSIDMITRITSQTNLLALNATIEAARAGEAGRGFSVVATEVKALAQQTAHVTDEISRQVKNVQQATIHAADGISGVLAMVLDLRDISHSISISVSQQTAAVGEISRSTAEVSNSTSDISMAVTQVSKTADEAQVQAAQALSEIEQLGGQTETLKATAFDFLKSVRA